MSRQVIGITGGIGSGKSTVSRVVEALGFAVYDCDQHAREIIDSDPEIKAQIEAEISPEAYVGGKLDRKLVSRIVFSDPQKLRQLNAITHQAVKNDFQRWLQSQTGEAAFVESAILYQSGLDKMVDAVWEVVAPEEIRVERVVSRSHISPEEVRQRIEAQKCHPTEPHPHTRQILNYGSHSVLIQVHRLLFAGDHLDLH